MDFADRKRGRWHDAWLDVQPMEVDLLREVMREISDSGIGHERISSAAGIHEHDLKNFLSPKKHRPKHWPGLRMLHYAANWRPQAGSLPRGLADKIEKLSTLAGKLSFFEPEEDHLFKHLQRLNLVEEEDCVSICEQISGNYYSHRLSRRPNHIIRSHYEILPFNPYDRLPRFINKLRYGESISQDNRSAETTVVERTSRGQIFQMAETYVLVGFVFYGYKWTRKTEYDGIQINIFPRQQFTVKSTKVIDGIFLSYVYNSRYEIGPMKLVRSSVGFKENEVGEFPADVLQSKESSFDLSSLKIDLSGMTNMLENSQANVPLTLLTCLSFIFGPQGIKTNN